MAIGLIIKGMAVLKITRSDEYMNRMRAIKIIIDGKQIGTIKNAEEKEFSLQTGNYTLQAKID